VYDDELRSRQYYEGRARWYDLANRVAALLRGTSGTNQRRYAIARLRLQPGARVLEVSVGTGTNVPLIREAYPNIALIAGIDISRSMLRRCVAKTHRAHAAVALVEADAAHLPFRDCTFDAVFHHGGIAEFGDRAAAIAEMARVARPGARMVICDVGVPTDRPLPFMSRMLLRAQPAYNRPPPLQELPPDAQHVQLSWFGGGAWYVVEFANGAGGDLSPGD
jgi:ubiquinone/menaquinone biosynthesis C-methylase UbiE